MSANRFPGICTVCGKRCGVGQGVAAKSSYGKWRVQHVSCSAAPATIAATAFAPPKRQKLPPRRKFCGINPW